MSKIPMVDDSVPDQLQCTSCLLPMQYQSKIDGKFLWQCFKCGKKYFVSENIDDNIEESWSPPR
jgi:ribosomal protein L37AE/L43A